MYIGTEVTAVKRIDQKSLLYRCCVLVGEKIINKRQVNILWDYLVISAKEKNKAVKENIVLTVGVAGLYSRQGRPSWEDVIWVEAWRKWGKTADTWAKSIPGRGSGEVKGPEMKVEEVCLRNRLLEKSR